MGVQRARNGEQIGAASSSGNSSSARAPAERKGERQGDAGSFEVAKREKRQAPQEGKRSDSSAGQKQSSSVGQKQSEGGRKKLARPSTARRRPPKVTENLVEQQMKQQEVVKQATAGIIRDGEDSESDEEDVNTRQS